MKLRVAGCDPISRTTPGRARWIAPRYLLLILALLLPAYFARAERYTWEEFDRKLEAGQNIAALGTDLFGDSVALHNGALSFSITDVSIPGNNALPVAFARDYSVINRKDYWGITDKMLADWDVSVPNISGVFATDWKSNDGAENRCSDTRGPPQYYGDSVHEYFFGLQLEIPGVGGGQLLVTDPDTNRPTDGKTYYWMTNDQIHLSCLPTIKNGTGEGFLAVAPDGTKYWFDWMAQFYEPTVVKAEILDYPNVARTHYYRRKNVLYATRVEDRFGNTVQYTYSNAWNQPGKLTAITASDGRQITVTYANGRVSTVNDGSRTWTYQYTGTPAGGTTLAAVTLPDASQWTINFAAFTDAELETFELSMGEPMRSCYFPELPQNYDITPTGVITHPSGAVGTFRVNIQEHGRSHVPISCSNFTQPTNYDGDDVNLFVISSYSFTLYQKQISGPGLETQVWDYSYAHSTGSRYYAGNASWEYPVCTSGAECYQPRVCDGGPCYGASTTTVTGPGEKWVRYHIGNSFRYNEGKLLKVERGSDASNILSTEANTYDFSLADQIYPASFGYSLQGNEGWAERYHRPLVKRVISQQDETFTWEIALCGTVYCSDAFANPTTVNKYSSLGHSRTDTTEYHEDRTAWVLGKVKRTTTGGIESSRTDYNAKSQPWKYYEFGRLQQTLAYNTDGTVSAVTDGRSNTTLLSGWKRGIPQMVQYPPTPEAPSGSSQSALVNDNGWITSVTDENGYNTGYAYDAMGRQTATYYPTADGVAWNTTTRAFEKVAAPEYGIEAGHWRQTVSTGDARSVTYFDALWRPLVEQRYDIADPATTLSMTVKRYDVGGRLAFQSYPQSTLVSYADMLTGTRTFYDALDRVTQIEQDSELGASLTTTVEYLPGFLRRTTNPRTVATTETFQAFDSPSFDAPVQIDAGVNTTDQARTIITRDLFGKPVDIARGPGG